MMNASQATARPAAQRRRRSDLPSISAALSDPVIRRVMEADGVDPRELERTLRGMARKLAHQGRFDGQA